MKWTKEVYESIETQLHKEKLKTFCFSLKEYQSLNWIESHEFIVDDQWYDVVGKIQQEDGSYLLTVFSDHIEKEWIAHFFKSKSNSTNSNSNNINQQDLKNFLFQDLIVDMDDLEKVKDSFIDLRARISEVHFSTLYPPPRLI